MFFNIHVQVHVSRSQQNRLVSVSMKEQGGWIVGPLGLIVGVAV